ncbi:hypothetical protein RJ641_019159 [Dillenia turbinata]|uniref:Uncharacterized protein n=1 Tax=Dillenia turbinata TaxID=194707 RepID=A0AAN8UGD0_9MAGN
MSNSLFSLSIPSFSYPINSRIRISPPLLGPSLRFHLLQASRRVPSFTQESENRVNDRRDWSRNRSGVIWRGHAQEDEGDEFDDDDADDDDGEEEDRSLDLLVRFIQSLFRKVSKRARKAVRSVLPLPVSAKLVIVFPIQTGSNRVQNDCCVNSPRPRDTTGNNLRIIILGMANSSSQVGFSVDGVIILAFLWVLKAFLEVVCTFGSIVFISILLIRAIWSGVTYLQESRNLVNGFDSEHRAWTGVRPAT